ncbi:hypothetical protein U9M48_040678 [Paspalum notatum var. saurae]|uniref:Uncharacterized protein n=1 Tax=Paspalum notatum var. saurae TaxID=547442 RepID=A0AAQ3UR27_PASNO
MECLNGGASSLGIQHLSALTKVEVTITGNHKDDWNYDPAEDNRHDGTVRFVSRAINAAIETLPNCPTVRFRTPNGWDCIHFKRYLRYLNEETGGLFIEWFEIWQIREEQAGQATDGETGQEEETNKGEEDDQTDEEKTDEKEHSADDRVNNAKPRTEYGGNGAMHRAIIGFKVSHVTVRYPHPPLLFSSGTPIIHAVLHLGVLPLLISIITSHRCRCLEAPAAGSAVRRPAINQATASCSHGVTVSSAHNTTRSREQSFMAGPPSPPVSASMGVMDQLLPKLSMLLAEEYDKLRGVSKQIKFLRSELGAMSVALQVLADAEHLSDQMKRWRDQVRELAYDIEDCIDAFMARADRERGGPTGILGLFHKFKRLVSRHEIANELQELKARAIEASERYQRYGFIEQVSKSRTCVVDPRLPALYEDIEKLVGIDGPKEEVMELLSMEMNGGASARRLRVVAIAGCGGLGKTTLAKQVYDSVKSQFTCAAFVSVSQSPDVRKILRDIAKAVGLIQNTHDDDDERQLIDKLREHLQDKRYFVVLDDVWDLEAWKFIKPALLNNDSGSRIITTTRNTTVALSFSPQGSNVYQMKPLSFSDSKKLLFKRAFGSENLCCTHLGSVPNELLKRCHGLPLAIIAISSILVDQHAKGEWDRVLSDIGSALARNPGAGTITTILSLSYFDCPRHLRSCLLYLSVFPEDYEIKKQHLINKWIAEGFINEEEGQTKYETGEDYFNDLINRSMIQPVDVKYGQAKACRVHDIILDYIKCKAAEENFVTSSDVVKHGYSSDYKVRRLCVHNQSEENATLWASLSLSQVRSVSIFGLPVNTFLLFSSTLRVLDLEEYRGMMKDHNLASIEKLFRLLYLRLCSRSIHKLPEKIGELQYLQTLDVRGTSIEELPPAITKLQRLTHLYVNREVRFPDGMIAQMLSLEELRLYGVQSLKQWNSLKEFSKLTKLRTLEIKWNFDLPDGSEGISQAKVIQTYVGTLLSLCNLQNLLITDASRMYPLSLDSWHPAAPCSLRKLWIKGFPIYKVPNWILSLGNLGVLKLWIFCLTPKDVEILGAIPSLVFLKLTTAGGSNGRIGIHGSKGFRSLKYFYLSIGCCGTALEFEAGSLPKVEHLNLVLCVHKMECRNGAYNLGIQHLSALCKIEFQIRGYRWDDNRCGAMVNAYDDTIRCVLRDISAAVEALPNQPTIRFENAKRDQCDHFKYQDKIDEEEEVKHMDVGEKEHTDDQEEIDNEKNMRISKGHSSRTSNPYNPHHERATWKRIIEKGTTHGIWIEAKGIVIIPDASKSK